jgi:hypothetical protein
MVIELTVKQTFGNSIGATNWCVEMCCGVLRCVVVCCVVVCYGVLWCAACCVVVRYVVL